MKKQVLQLIALACLSLTGSTHTLVADEFHVAKRLLCSDGKALIQIETGWNAHPEFSELPYVFKDDFSSAIEPENSECDLGYGARTRMLRVKFGTYPGRHFGMCGGVTKYFFSMWIDQRHILSRKVYSNTCSRFENLAFVYYSGSNLILCSRPNTDGPVFSVTQEDSGTPRLACIDSSEIYLRAIKSPIDTIEYPPGGGSRREGHVVTIRSTVPELCSNLHDAFQAGSGKFHEVFKGGSVNWSGGPMGKVGPFELDINNDGFKDLVGVVQYSPGSSGEFLVMLDEGKEGQPLASFPKELTLRDVLSLPPLIPIADTIYGEDFDNWRDRRVLVKPFEWNDTVLILLSGVYDTRPPRWTVYRLNHDNSVSEICVLDRVAIHY